MKKIKEAWQNVFCKHPEHNPPAHIVLEPGVYEHTCPGCGRVQTVTVTGPLWKEEVT